MVTRQAFLKLPRLPGTAWPCAPATFKRLELGDSLDLNSLQKRSSSFASIGTEPSPGIVVDAAPSPMRHRDRYE